MHPIQEELNRRGWTIPELARRTRGELSERAVYNVVLYGRPPRLTTQRAILRALKLKWEERGKWFPKPNGKA